MQQVSSKAGNHQWSSCAGHDKAKFAHTIVHKTAFGLFMMLRRLAHQCTAQHVGNKYTLQVRVQGHHRTESPKQRIRNPARMFVSPSAPPRQGGHTVWYYGQSAGQSLHVRTPPPHWLADLRVPSIAGTVAGTQVRHCSPVVTESAITVSELREVLCPPVQQICSAVHSTIHVYKP
jgi:hypothetical protein